MKDKDRDHSGHENQNDEKEVNIEMDKTNPIVSIYKVEDDVEVVPENIGDVPLKLKRNTSYFSYNSSSGSGIDKEETEQKLDSIGEALVTEEPCEGLTIDQLQGRLPWYPWPRPGQKVKRPCCMKKYEHHNPFEHHVCSCWWWSYILCGADRTTLDIPEDHLSVLAERFDWDLNIPDKPYLQEFVKKIEYPEEVSDKVNALTIIPKLGFTWVMSWLCRKHFFLGHVCFFVFTLVLIPSVFVIILYGLVPVGYVNTCTIGNYAVWIFFTNNLTSLGFEFCFLQLYNASIDEKCPWRPLWIYLPFMFGSFVFRTFMFGLIVFGVGTFSLFGLVNYLVSFFVIIITILATRKPVLAFDVHCYKGFSISEIKRIAFGSKEENIDKVMVMRMYTFIKALVTIFIGFLCYTVYLLAIKYGSPDVQQASTFFVFVFEIALRKFLQHICVSLTREMNFILSGLLVYNMHAVFTVFSTPNIGNSKADKNHKLDDFYTYLILFSKPLMYFFIALFHQSDLWFRFRNWVKKMHEQLVMCKKPDYMIVGIEQEVDFEGRGTTNAHRDYRRGKVSFDFYKFIGSMTGYASFIFVNWILYIGPNKHAFPYQDNADVTIWEDNTPYSYDDFVNSMVFATITFFACLIFLIIYKYYLKKFYQPSFYIYKLTLKMWHEQPHLIGLAMMVCSLNLMFVTSLLLTFNRVWFFQVNSIDTAGSCKGNPLW